MILCNGPTCLQGLTEMDNAVKIYKDVLQFNNMHVEAIACIATHYFYTDQPEMALKFYRWVFMLCRKIEVNGDLQVCIKFQ